MSTNGNASPRSMSPPRTGGRIVEFEGIGRFGGGGARGIYTADADGSLQAASAPCFLPT